VSEPADHVMARVWGAALAAAADRETAEDVTVSAFASADGGADADQLAATAVRLALRAAPAPEFGLMETPDAEAVALARLLGFKLDRIAAVLGVEVPEVRRRMRGGLAAVSRGRPPALTADAPA
jgi:DNA-directed RNA polymerase specialized sigma24 family protein